MKKKIILMLTILLLVVLTACNCTGTVTPTVSTPHESTKDSVQADTFVEATETTSETEEPTEKKDSGVTFSENVTIDRTESNSSTTQTVVPSETSKPPKATQSNKMWHNAVYDYIKHPAETKEEWVVDEEAYNIEMPIYGDKEVTICDVCEADITSELTNHQHDGGFTFHNEIQTHITGYDTVEVPERGHYETVVVKEAWTERVLVKEAGYY